MHTAFKAIAPRNRDAAAALDKWDVYGPPTPGLAEQVYFFEPIAGDHGLARVLLANAAADKGVSVSFPVAQLPHFILWKNTVAYEDGYVTGLGAGDELSRTRGRSKRSTGACERLAPGESVQAELYFEIHPDRSSVAAAAERVSKIQQQSKPTIHRQPQPDWSS